MKKTFSNKMKIEDFLLILSEVSNIKLEELQLWTGYPPSMVAIPQQVSLLQDLDIHSGSVLVLRAGTPPSCFTTKITTSEGQRLEIDRRQSSLEEKQEWSCNACTLQNPNANSHCEICGAKKPQLKMTRRVIDADNSCLYNCFGYLLLRSLSMSTKLRGICSEMVADNAEKYNAALLGREIDDYKMWVTKQDTWGGEVEISILSSYFQMGVGIVDIRTNQIYVYSSDDESGENFKERVYLLYDGIHYDALVRAVEGGENINRIDTDITIVSSLDDVAFNECKKIAADLKEKQQYVDTSSFQLKCLVCGVGLVGQMDASEHAKSTGHQNFGQMEA